MSVRQVGGTVCELSFAPHTSMSMSAPGNARSKHGQAQRFGKHTECNR
jgi:hypothetical protein